MRKPIMFWLAILLTACINNGINADRYHQQMVESQAKLMNNVDHLSRNLPSMDSLQATTMLEETTQLANNLKAEILLMPPFAHDTLLKSATLKVIAAYQTVIDHELKQLAQMTTSGRFTDNNELREAKIIRQAIIKKLIGAERAFARQEGHFRRTFLKGKTDDRSDTTLFAADTVDQSEL